MGSAEYMSSTLTIVNMGLTGRRLGEEECGYLPFNCSAVITVLDLMVWKMER